MNHNYDSSLGMLFCKNQHDKIFNYYGSLAPTHNKSYGLLKLRTIYRYNQFGCAFTTQL